RRLQEEEGSTNPKLPKLKGSSVGFHPVLVLEETKSFFSARKIRSLPVLFFLDILHDGERSGVFAGQERIKRRNNKRRNMFQQTWHFYYGR
ncbi:apocytochrome b, partial [Sesbania bispinosa]